MPIGKRTSKLLNFDLLEDALVSPPDKAEKEVQGTRIVRIGPLVEYAYHQYPTAFERLSKWSAGSARRLRAVLNVRNLTAMPESPLVNPDPSGVEFTRTPQIAAESEDSRWRTFCRRLANAGLKAGFDNVYSNAIAGTFEEMVSNAVEHSELPMTAVAGYRWGVKELEYVVADAGIGVLKSLRQHPDYHALNDASEALVVTIGDGNSRFGKAAGRGNGFHDLLVNIANRNSYLRFRSGNYRLTIDGTKGEQPIQTARRCAPFQGFLISVVCQKAK